MKNPVALAVSFAFAFFCIGLAFEPLYNPATPAPLKFAPAPPTPVVIEPDKAAAPATEGTFLSNFEKATADLFVDDNGDLRFACTATAFQKTGTGYLILTAKHCVKNATKFFVVFDDKGKQPYIQAELLCTGDGVDAAILQIVYDQPVPIIALGSEKPLVAGDAVINMASPMNLGKLLFRGSVIVTVANERAAKGDAKGSMLLELPAAGGSSGSAVVDERQDAIVAIVTGIWIPANGGVIVTLATPVSQVRQMLLDYKAGKHGNNAIPHPNFFDRFFK